MLRINCDQKYEGRFKITTEKKEENIKFLDDLLVFVFEDINWH